MAEGLAGVDPLEVRHRPVYDEAEAAAFAPDVVVVATESPDRDTIDSLREENERLNKVLPIYQDRQFMEDTEEGLIQDGLLEPTRLRLRLAAAEARLTKMQTALEQIES